MQNAGKIPEFKTEKERQAWIIENAEYYTVVSFLGAGQFEKYEEKLFSHAMEIARSLANLSNRSYMIYAVVAPYDTYVTTIRPVTTVKSEGG